MVNGHETGQWTRNLSLDSKLVTGRKAEQWTQNWSVNANSTEFQNSIKLSLLRSKSSQNKLQLLSINSNT